MAAELRIAFLTNLIPPYHKPLFELLSQRYSHVRLFISTSMEANRPWRPEWSGLDVVVQKGLTLRRTWRHPRGFREHVAVHLPTDTLSQLAKFDPDAVISVEMGFRTLLAYAYTRAHPRCRLLIWTEVTDATEHGRGVSRQLMRRFLAGRAHGFLAVGMGGVRYIHHLGVPLNKVFKINYSTSLAPFVQIPLDRHGAAAKRLLFSGQLIQRKGLLSFIDVLLSWAVIHPDRQVEFRLVGDGPQAAALRAVPMPANIKLTFIGALQYNQLPDVYASSGIFVLPTLADTWAVVVNEAMASGVPVLGSVYSQAVEEMVEDGKSGWTFRPDHSAEMYSALDRALSSTEEQLNGMRASARARALEVTPEQAASVCEDALLAAVGNH